jgi:subtilisin family serine protease
VKLHNYQVMTPYSSTWGNFIAAMDYIVASQATNHIQAINASIEGVSIGAPYQAVATAIQSVVNLGIVFVVAAGNDSCDIYGGGCSWTQNGPAGPGSGNDVCPAAVREALVVSAMDPNPTNSTYDTIASYSNGSWSVVAADPLPPDSPAVPVTSPGLAIDLAAPGTDITSLYPGGIGAIMSGTSMATAHVTGLVALYLAANPAPANPDANWVYSIRQTLINSGLPQSQWGVTNTFDPDGNPEPLAVVSESWIPQPNILGWSVAPEGVQLTFLTVPGYTYTMQYSDSSPQPAWSNLTTNANTLGSVTTNTVTDATPNPDGRFYRLQRSPAP